MDATKTNISVVEMEFFVQAKPYETMHKIGYPSTCTICLKTYANDPTPRYSCCSFMNVTDHVIVKTCSLLEMINSSVLDKVQRGEESTPETDIICDLFIGCSKPKIFLSGLDHGLTSHSENHTS